MANPEHVEILKQGVDVWNRWREDNPHENPDLKELKFRNKHLIGADFNNSDLKGSKFRLAFMMNATLRGSDLRETIFQKMSLKGVDFSGVSIGSTLFINVDLSDSLGLELIKHRGPSYIDISTIIRSRGNIPQSFLRGCGIPNNFIEYISSLTTQCADTVGRDLVYAKPGEIVNFKFRECISCHDNKCCELFWTGRSSFIAPDFAFLLYLVDIAK